jgi:hypothetical protein
MQISNIEMFAHLCDEESAFVIGGLQRVEGEGGSWEGGRRPVYSGPIDPNIPNKTNEALTEAGITIWEIGCKASLIGLFGLCSKVGEEIRKST